jgi:DNA-binding NarL/FixJ family response regulator
MPSPASPTPLNWYAKEQARQLNSRRGGSGSPQRLLRILIADERPIFCDGLKALLETSEEFKVVGQAHDKETLLSVAEQKLPDVVLLDQVLAHSDEMGILHALTTYEHPVRTLLFCADMQKSDILRVLQLGARGVILKNSTSQMLMDGIRKVVDGQYWIGEESVVSLVEATRDLTASVGTRAVRPRFGLTPRELEIISTVVSGYSNSDIASNFALSEHTVKHHLSRVFDKLGVSNRLELALFAVNHQLTSDLP